MPYRLGWFHGKDVLYLELIGVISEEDYRGFLQRLIIEGEPDEADFCVLADNRRIEKWPSLASMTKVTMPEQHNWMIVIGVTNPFLKFISSTAGQILGLRMKMVDTLPDAVRTLKRVMPLLYDVDLSPTLDHVEWFAASSPELLDALPSKKPA